MRCDVVQYIGLGKLVSVRSLVVIEQRVNDYNPPFFLSPSQKEKKTTCYIMSNKFLFIESPFYHEKYNN